MPAGIRAAPSIFPHDMILPITLRQRLEILRLVKVLLSRLRQEGAPVAAIPSRPQDGIEITADLAGIAVPAERLKREFQLCGPATLCDGCGRGQPEIDAFMVFSGAHDLDLKGLIVRRYFELEVRIPAVGKRDE